jgi:hypothetical protein
MTMIDTCWERGSKIVQKYNRNFFGLSKRTHKNIQILLNFQSFKVYIRYMFWVFQMTKNLQ